MRAFSGIATTTHQVSHRPADHPECLSSEGSLDLALRLTSNSPTSDDARLDGGSVALRATGAFGATLAGKARALLIAGDIDGYRALFARPQEQEDPSARYHARVLLLEEGLTAAGQAQTTTQAAQLFADVAKAGLDSLDEQPSEPIILGYTGVALSASCGASTARVPCSRQRSAWSPRCRTSSRTSPQLKDRRRNARRNARPLHPSRPGACHPRQADRRARQARLGPDPEPLHDRPRRGGDAPALPRRRGPAVDEVMVVDTGRSTHRRDRG